MSIFICEKCGKLDNTACSNNYWHAKKNKYKQSKGEKPEQSYKPEFDYFENHICCSDCCKDVTYIDGSGVLGYGRFDIADKKHWSEFGKEQLLEWEARNDGSMVNATEYFSANSTSFIEEK